MGDRTALLDGRLGQLDERIAQLDERIDTAVDEFIAADAERLGASRLLTIAFTALFALVTLICVITGEWEFAIAYGLVAAGAALFIRRFLRHDQRL